MVGSALIGMIWAGVNDVGHIHEKKREVDVETDPVLKKIKQDLLDREVQERLFFDSMQ